VFTHTRFVDRKFSILACGLQTLKICIALVERRSIWQTAFDNELAKSPPQEEDGGLEQQAVKMLAPHAANLLKRLSEDESQPLLVQDL